MLWPAFVRRWPGDGRTMPGPDRDPNRAGLVIVDKPPGWTSHDVVARLRRVIGMRRVGHAGTLDPMATGVLVCGFGRATRLLGHLARGDKEYRATIRLGWSTVTDDATGDRIVNGDETAGPTSLAGVTDSRISAAGAEFVGDIRQRPSNVSAIKVDGRRAHQRVRAGEEFELPARPVTVSRFDIEEIRRGLEFIDLDVAVACSTGTYVRALARDLGGLLGPGGHLTYLRRTRVGPFTDRLAVPIDEVDPDGGAGLIDLAEAARLAFPTWTVAGEQARRVRTGFPVEWTGPADAGLVAVVDEAGELLALAHESEGRADYTAVLAPSGELTSGE